jgi:CubicO group peptidase (beta-lactamase class C family)
VIPGAGAILSTTADLAKFVQANFKSDQQALKLQQQRTYTVSNDRDMALGWFIRKKDRQRIYWHSGGTGGYRSMLVLDRDSKNGVVVLSNISSGHEQAGRISSLGFSLLEGMELKKKP